MTEMTDYEINLRLAKIAGIEDIPWLHKPHPPYVRMPGFVPYSPLTDWSQLGPLMEQHVWDIERHLGPTWSVWAQGFERHSVLPGATDADLKRAICLAIIAAHEE